jgi:translocator protein
MKSWYDELKKPPQTPPKRIFGPVWAALYLLIFLALLAYFLSPAKPGFFLAIFMLVIHFAAGFSWTSIFFGRKLILAALLDLLLMDMTLAVIMPLFLQASTIAALLLAPYCCWCLFATWLNWRIWRLNPGS